MKLLKMEIERLISEIKNYRLDNIVGLAVRFAHGTKRYFA